MASKKLIHHLHKERAKAVAAAAAAVSAAPVPELPPYTGPVLPAQCPRCGRHNGERPAFRWLEHQWTGFDGWQCGACGFLLPRAAIADSEPAATSPSPAA